MKYYAVTEDPNELLHYGVKGMKWGQHIFGDKPKSAGYHRAAAKLRGIRKARSAPKSTGIRKTQASANKRAKQQNAFSKAVQKEQQNAKVLTRMNKLDNDKKFYKQVNREIRRENKIARQMQKVHRAEQSMQVSKARQQAKQMKQAAKIDRKFDKVLQQAREGRLRYGKLNEEQIQRVQDRLAAEANARRLGGTEKPSWRQQKKEARRAGKLQGITKGTAAAMEEVAKAGTQYGINHLINRMTMRTKAKQEGKNERIKNKIKNKKSTRDIKKEVKQEINEEAYKTRLLEGDDGPNFLKLNGVKYNAAYLRKVDERKKLSEAEKQEKDAEEQLKRSVYSRIVLGGKGDTTDTIITRLNKREDYRKQIWGETDSKPVKYDQAGSNSSSKATVRTSPIKKTYRLYSNALRNSNVGGSVENLYEKSKAKVSNTKERRRTRKVSSGLKG